VKLKKLHRRITINIALAWIIAVLVFALHQNGLLQRAEDSSIDFVFNLRGNLTSNPHIVIIEITDNDIAKVGRWPWKRSWQAAITQALTELGAKSLYFDIIFSEASDEQDDALFEEALKRSKRVYLPFAFQAGDFNINEAFLPIKRFSAYIKGTGATNIWPDQDGIIRRIPLLFQTENKIYPHVALKIALDYDGLNIQEINPRYLRVNSLREQIIIPLENQNTLLINWVGKWQQTFKHYSFLDVLAIYKDYVDNKLPIRELKDFKDSICLIGLTAVGLYDIKPIPLQPEYPGLGVVATTINDIINRKFLTTPLPSVDIFIFFLLAIFPALLISGEKPLKESLLLLLIAVAYYIVNFILFNSGLLMDFFTPLLGFSLSSLTVGTYNFVRIAIERQSFFKMSVTDGLTGLFNIRYFKMLLETEMMMARQDVTKKFAICMSDVDHFKIFNDTYGHQVGDLVLKEVANSLKDTARSSDIVARYGGEEMIVLLRGVSLKDAMIVAEKFRKGIENHVVKDEKNSYKVTTSFGVSIFHNEDTVDSLIKRADDGLYKSKEGGRNCASTVEESG
jgi:diguanylate cyclase (GGDEF)-like protein